MEKGELRLPPGFRFHPTDEELVVQYLKRKVFSCPLPASIIPEVDLCKSDPWDLPGLYPFILLLLFLLLLPLTNNINAGDLEQERYFFSTKEAKYPNGNRSNRATKSGYWKATGLDKRIVSSKGNQVVGIKKTLVFYRGKPPHGSRTDWIMHEYRLLNTCSHWVLCRIFLKRRTSGAAPKTLLQEEGELTNPTPALVFYDFLAQNKPKPDSSSSSSSSSAASEITELSTRHDSDHEHEQSSSSNTFPYFRWKQS
ncbi:hypothetical protein Fmac_017012 [Flemingia macrophylla]|uniref:NAC domain-containing protein n=1 Tax=Flemingia macrophylla TaxID=520843 RepID=A0ABD1M129_9FABA